MSLIVVKTPSVKDSGAIQRTGNMPAKVGKQVEDEFLEIVFNINP